MRPLFCLVFVLFSAWITRAGELQPPVTAGLLAGTMREALLEAGEIAERPVRVTDLMAISDAGGIMPPKSTWFEPKLRDGLLTHLL